jgi:hypothetical protein
MTAPLAFDYIAPFRSETAPDNVVDLAGDTPEMLSEVLPAKENGLFVGCFQHFLDVLFYYHRKTGQDLSPFDLL